MSLANVCVCVCALKVQAIIDIAFSKIQHIFANIHSIFHNEPWLGNGLVSTRIAQDVLSSRK